jgi:hypothetical protein
MRSASAPIEATFVPEIVLPAQFFSTAPAGTERPERRLMLAVLEDAIGTVLKHRAGAHGRSRRLLREAEQWIHARNQDWPFSFENICSVLNLDAGARRAGLRNITGGAPARLVALPLGRRVVGERHRVSVPRRHHRAIVPDTDG